MRRSSAAVSAILVVLAASAPAVAAGPVTAGNGTQPNSSYIIRYTDGTDVADEIRNSKALGITPSRTFTHVFPGYVARLNAAQIAGLEHNPNIASIEMDAPTQLYATAQTGATWGLDRIEQRSLPLDGSYSYANTGAVKVYVIDTGLLTTHNEIAGRTAAGYTSIADGNGTTDCNGHGTHVAGTIAGTTYGVAKGATIIPVRVLDCAGSGTTSGVIAGLDWAISHHTAGVPAVANMSLGGGVSSSLDTAVQNLINDGVTVIVAAGNSSTDACTSSPARVPAAITVAATDSTDVQAYYSNFGSCVDIYAPGSAITSSWYTSNTATNTISGTSMATPHVVGAAALLLAANQSLTPSQVNARLVTNATVGAVISAGVNTPNRLLFTDPNGTVVVAPVATAPSAATSLTATAARKSASLTWTRGNANGSPITGQTVNIYIGSTKVGTISVSSTATSANVTGLRTGTVYSFSVVETNAVGNSPESARSNQVTVK